MVSNAGNGLTSREGAKRALTTQEQNERILRAVAEVVNEVGPGGLTVALVIERAGVSRSTFYKLFDSGSDALGKALDAAGQHLRGVIEAGSSRSEPRGHNIGMVISALLTAVAEEPALAALCLIHAYAIPGARTPFQPVFVEPLVRVLREGRAEVRGPERPPRTEEFIAVGILSVIGERLRRGEVDPQEGLVAELTALALRC